MPEIKVPETGGVVRRALDERRRLSNVARGAMEAWKVPRGRNGWIRPTRALHALASSTAAIEHEAARRKRVPNAYC